MHAMRSRPRPRAGAGGGGGGCCRAAGWGGGGGHGSLGGRPPGARTPGSGCVKSDLHPAAQPPRPRCGVLPRAGVLVLRGCGGDPGAGNTAYHTAYTLGIEASTAPVAACWSRGAARDLSP